MQKSMQCTFSGRQLFPWDTVDGNSYKVNCGGHSRIYIHWSDGGVLHGNHPWSPQWPEGIWPCSPAVYYMHPHHHGFHCLCKFVCIQLEIESQHAARERLFEFRLWINLHLWPTNKTKLNRKENHNYRLKKGKASRSRKCKALGSFLL